MTKSPATKPANLTMHQANCVVQEYLRPKPYTEAGLARMTCVHCGAPAKHQWSLRPCAIGRTGWYPLCDQHDLMLNRITMDFLRLPDADARLAAYTERMKA